MSEKSQATAQGLLAERLAEQLSEQLAESGLQEYTSKSALAESVDSGQTRNRCVRHALRYGHHANG